MSSQPLAPRQNDVPLVDGGRHAPRADVVPGELRFCLPAHPNFAQCIGSAVETTLALSDRELAAGTCLGAAVLAMVDAMLVHARPWTPLEVSISSDETDVYIRLTAELWDPDGSPQLDEHGLETLRRSVESYEFLQDGSSMLVVLQAPLDAIPSA